MVEREAERHETAEAVAHRHDRSASRNIDSARENARMVAKTHPPPTGCFVETRRIDLDEPRAIPESLLELREIAVHARASTRNQDDDGRAIFGVAQEETTLTGKSDLVGNRARAAVRLHEHLDLGADARLRPNLELPPDRLGALAHADEAEAVAVTRGRVEASAAIDDP